MAIKVFTECPMSGLDYSNCTWKKRPGTIRDAEGVGVRECDSCGLVTHEQDLRNMVDYKKESMHTWSTATEAILPVPEMDATRRLRLLMNLTRDFHRASVMDFGSGRGEMMDILSDKFNVYGLEPEEFARTASRNRGLTVFEGIEDALNSNLTFDVVTMFHVVEHLYEPSREIKNIHKVLRPDGFLVIETPNSDDALITLFDSIKFMDFTYWSHHPMLHSHISLQALVERCGFKVLENSGTQRYGLANHLYWLSHGKPGGHDIFSNIFSPEAEIYYARDLEAKQKSDTIWLIAKKFD
jgi:SAM-dependent methyltransferase